MGFVIILVIILGYVYCGWMQRRILAPKDIAIITVNLCTELHLHVEIRLNIRW